MSLPYTCVLWDVDGTIVDASVGILRRLTISLERLGLPAPTEAELTHWIGPPMFESFQTQAHLSPEEAEKAVAHYRELGKADGYTTDVRLYPGVADLIHELHDRSVPQATASSKPEVQVKAILEHFELAPLFASITGATADERTLGRKADIVAEALRRLEAQGIDVSRPVLIGDRHHDVEGGTERGVPVIFVDWGFSSPGEAEGAVAEAADIEALRALVLPAA
ncbi:MAG: HAD hydrolase-like protein [Microbacterium ginsengisoli]|uniref:HAD hydrolase-like protein n=1 Tax=Microbacterium TaxID=33882 RepID=UPI0006F971D1|nr:MULTISPECIES: HAD hydrolase-like protein [unclassified Microbacterium]KQR92105.1 phosphatase [Microbacterium sp. Leaf347]KQS05858.1 phosphatase [Microbacterium sp. Leaf351]MBN9197716.1 HAD hydrolase-like protein [Microbacterium ginsengisoli]OJU79364.1 MAG: phosphatase [Microbacterium sp. 71-23]